MGVIISLLYKEGLREVKENEAGVDVPASWGEEIVCNDHRSSSAKLPTAVASSS